MPLRPLLTLTLLAALASAAPVPFAKPSRPAEMIGTWEWTRTEHHNSPPSEHPRPTRMRVEEGRWTFLTADGMRPGPTYCTDFDRTRSPMWLDLRGPTPGTPKQFLGVLRVEKDEMRWAYASATGSRPADTRVAGPNEKVYVFRRVKKEGAR